MSAYSDRDAVIVGAVRTPVGKGKANGALHDVLPVDLLAHSLRELVERTGVDPGQGRRRHRRRGHPGRRPVDEHRPQRAAGRRLPRERAGHHRRPAVRKQPAGNQFRRPGRARRRLRRRDRRGRRVDVPGRRWAARVLPGSDPFGQGIADRYPDGLVPQGISAELIAAKWGLSRTELDEFSAEQPREGRPRDQGRAVRQRARADRRPVHRRDHPARHHGRDARRTAARVLQRGVLGSASRRSTGRSPPATRRRCPTAAPR